MSERKGWFSDYDNDEPTDWKWQPCFEAGGGHIPCFNVHFRTKSQCDEWINENVIGAGWLDDPAPITTPTDTPAEGDERTAG